MGEKNKTDPRESATVFVEEDFRLDDPGRAWSFRTPQLWSIVTEADRRLLRMAPPPDRPDPRGVRRPQEYALYTEHEFRSFSLSCRLRVDCDISTAGRDACVIFGWRDETHFYYVHLSNVADGFHNSIVRVDGDTRASLLPPGTRPPSAVPDQQWHKVDVLRDVDAGTITVYVDAHEQKEARPWIQIKDRTYEWGHIGLGSFNDHASFAHLLIEGQARTPRRAPASAPGPLQLDG